MGHAPDWTRKTAKKDAGTAHATHSETFCNFERPVGYFDGGAVTSYRDGGKVQGYARGGFVSGLAAGALAGLMMMRGRDKKDAETKTTTKTTDAGFTPVSQVEGPEEDSNAGMAEAANANKPAPAKPSKPKATPKVKAEPVPSIMRNDVEREGGAISYPANSSTHTKSPDTVGSSTHYKNPDLKVDVNASNISGGERQIDPRFRKSAEMAEAAKAGKKTKASDDRSLGNTFDFDEMNIAP